MFIRKYFNRKNIAILQISVVIMCTYYHKHRVPKQIRNLLILFKFKLFSGIMSLNYQLGRVIFYGLLNYAFV